VQKLKVSLPDHLRDQLEAAAKAEGISLGEVIRRKLEHGFEVDRSDGPTRGLMSSVARLATFIRLDTGQEWHSHPAGNRTMRHALTARLARLKPGERTPSEVQFKPEELPERRLLMFAETVEQIGQGLEALEAQGADPEQLLKFSDKVMQDFPQHFPRKEKKS
jgi:hypothetical protein